MTVFMLWENHATGSIERFGPHVFLVACVADRLQRDRFELSRSRIINGRSCNGNSGVLRELGPGRPPWDAAPHLVAVLDSDKLHILLGGEARSRVADPAYAAWSEQMDEQCRQRIGVHDAARLTICFFDRNLETLLEILQGAPVQKKDVLERDKLLHRAAGDPALIQRASERMPSWAHLVVTVAQRIEQR